jgi:hypothetical protein
VVFHDVSPDHDRRSLGLYYSTRNLIEVMRRHAAWYQRAGSAPSFLLRWIGYFAVMAVLRGQPGALAALGAGVIDGARGRLGRSGRVRDPRESGGPPPRSGAAARCGG